MRPCYTLIHESSSFKGTTNGRKCMSLEPLKHWFSFIWWMSWQGNLHFPLEGISQVDSLLKGQWTKMDRSFCLDQMFPARYTLYILWLSSENTNISFPYTLALFLVLDSFYQPKEQWLQRDSPHHTPHTPTKIIIIIITQHTKHYYNQLNTLSISF